MTYYRTYPNDPIYNKVFVSTPELLLTIFMYQIKLTLGRPFAVGINTVHHEDFPRFDLRSDQFHRLGPCRDGRTRIICLVSPGSSSRTYAVASYVLFRQ